MADRILPFRRCHGILGTCPLAWCRDFADGSKLTILRGEMILDDPSGPSVTTEVLQEGGRRVRVTSWRPGDGDGGESCHRSLEELSSVWRGEL